MLKSLKKAYPLISEDGYTKVNIIILILSITVFLFLYIIQPKLLYSDIYYTLDICLLFASITYIISLFYSTFFPRIFPSLFLADKWTVGKEILYVFIIVLTIAITNYIVGSYIFYPEKNFEILHFIKVVSSTLLVAIIPLGVFVIISQRINYNKLKRQSQNLNSAIEEHIIVVKNDNELKLSGQGKYEELQIASNNILYVESTGNYCDIVFLKDAIIQKKTLRITLKNIQEQINLPDTIIKTHRSYLVNLNHIIHAKGNAQGYQLSINGITEFTVPVSRANVSVINERMKGA